MSPATPLEAFDEALDGFRAAYGELNESLSPLGMLFSGGRAIETGVDIVSFCSIMREVHVAAVASSAAETGALGALIVPLIPAEDTSEWPPEKWFEWWRETTDVHADRFRAAMELHANNRPLEEKRRLHAVYKATFYFVRAYQDLVCGVLIELIEGRRRKVPRMQKELAKQTDCPVGDAIRSELPEYPAWFEVWREQRNRIKEGYCFHLRGPDEDLGVAFTAPNEAS